MFAEHFFRDVAESLNTWVSDDYNCKILNESDLRTAASSHLILEESEHVSELKAAAERASSDSLKLYLKLIKNSNLQY